MGTFTEELRVKLGQLDLFPGSLSEYCTFKKGDYEIMDTGVQKKYVHFDPDIVKKGIIAAMERPVHIGDFVTAWTERIESGCEGLIRYDVYQRCGIPVRRKK
jgi:hypothetical protein